MGLPRMDGGNAQILYEGRGKAETIRSLVDYMDGQPSTSFLLSSEWLLVPGEPLLKEVVDALATPAREVRVIAYVREQREWLMSRYAQAVKSRRWSLSLEQYLEEAFEIPGLDYADLFQKTAAAVGEERLILRLFDTGDLAGGDVRRDIFDIIGVAVDDLLGEEEEAANASASAEELEVARLMNAAAPKEVFNPRRFLTQTAKVIADRDWAPERRLYRLVDPALMESLGAHYAESNEAFRKQFFPDLAAPLFASRIPKAYTPMSAEQRLNQRSFELLSSYIAWLARHERARARRRTRRSQTKVEGGGA
jgi:hypothetical protein